MGTLRVIRENSEMIIYNKWFSRLQQTFPKMHQDSSIQRKWSQVSTEMKRNVQNHQHHRRPDHNHGLLFIISFFNSSSTLILQLKLYPLNVFSCVLLPISVTEHNDKGRHHTWEKTENCDKHSDGAAASCTTAYLDLIYLLWWLFCVPLMSSIPEPPLSAHYFSDGGHAAQGKTSSLRLGRKSHISLSDCFGRQSPENQNSPLMLQMSYWLTRCQNQ